MQKMKATVNLIVIYLFLSFERGVGFESQDVINTNRKYFREEGPHVFKEYEGCSSSFYGKFHKTSMRATCMPRPTIVQLIESSPEILLVPSKIMVNRCAGECHAKQSCLATDSTNSSYEVQQLDIFENTQKCGVVHVEEHTRCSCKCTVMKEHCNEKQVYKPGECMCICFNDEERKMCNETPGRFWDRDQCKCQCHEKKICSTGLFWIPEHCSCAKLMGYEDNEIE